MSGLNIVMLLYYFCIVEAIILFFLQLVYFSTIKENKKSYKLLLLNVLIIVLSVIYYFIIKMFNINGYKFRESFVAIALFLLIASIMLLINIYIILLLKNIYKNLTYIKNKFSITNLFKFILLPMICIVAVAIFAKLTIGDFRLMKDLVWSDFFFGWITFLIYHIVVFAFCTALVPISLVIKFKK